MKETNAMTDYKCPPPDDCASQPHDPGDSCRDLPITTCPVLSDPDPCPPDPDHKCWCPKKPDKTKECLEKRIDDQTEPIAKGEKAKLFKSELEALLAKAQTATQEYSREKYDQLVKRWVEEDCDIAELVRKLVCAVPCWRCVIECYVCPLLYEMKDAELRLFRTGTPDTTVNNLQELLFCQKQDKAAKERTFARIKAVLAAWEKPATTIDKVLADNAKRIVDAGKSLGSEGTKVVYDVFLKLIPLHLAIAPPGSKLKTKIAREYTEFCHCDRGYPDTCCGPDAGELSLRERLIGVQPYLIDPNDYFKVICCLVDHRYQPAKDQSGAAEAAVTTTENLIKRYEAVVVNGLKNFDRDARAAIPAVVDCSMYESD
jgi:hypothetical protein